MKIPKLWRRTVAGKLIGAFHVTVKGARINLGTQDAGEAAKRRKLALAGRRKFKDDIEGAAEETIAALDGAAPAQAGAGVDAAAATDTGAHPPPAPAPPPPPASSELPAPAQQQQAPSDWAAAANDAASAPVDGAGGSAAPGEALPADDAVKLADLPFLKGALVTASKVIVSLQVKLQAWTARLIGDVEVARVGPEPVKIETPEQFAAMTVSGEPWPGNDPREPGRQIWEGFLKRVCPDDLPIADWILAPLVVAMYTLPVQLSDMKKIDHSKDPKPEQEAAPETRAAA